MNEKTPDVRSVRVSTVVTPTDLEIIDKNATDQGRSRSNWFYLAIRAQLQRDRETWTDEPPHDWNGGA